MLNKSVLIPACLRVFLSQPDIVQDTTALDSLNGLKRLIYSFNVSTTHNALSSPKAKQVIAGEA